MQHSLPILVFKPLNPIPPILYLLPLHPYHRLMLLAIFLHLLRPLYPSDSIRFFNGKLEVSKSGALNFNIFFHLIPLTLSVSRNLTLIHLPFSGSLNSLLCDLIIPTPGLAFSLLIPRTLVATSSFSSGRANPPLNFLPCLFLCLTPTLIM